MLLFDLLLADLGCHSLALELLVLVLMGELAEAVDRGLSARRLQAIIAESVSLLVGRSGPCNSEHIRRMLVERCKVLLGWCCLLVHDLLHARGRLLLRL